VTTSDELLAMLGTDGLRLWASSTEIGGDPVVSDVVIRNVQEVFRKIRNTCRFLVSTLYDFDYDKDAISFNDLSVLDQYALQSLYVVHHQLLSAYNEYDFSAIFHTTGTYCAVDLSAFYLDIIKDRLYVESHNGKKRRAAQTVCFVILDALTRILAPVLSFMTEQLSDLYQKNKTESIHLQHFAPLEWIAQAVYACAPHEGTVPPECAYWPWAQMTAGQRDEVIRFVAQQERWDLIFAIRNAFLKKIEEQREKGMIKHSLEAQVTFFIDPTASWHETWISFVKDGEKQGEVLCEILKQFLIVSLVKQELSSHPSFEKTGWDGLWVQVKRAEGVKCPRCWHYCMTERPDGLCGRCAEIVKDRVGR
jgi:isoleucyl-tRNA synthetase